MSKIIKGSNLRVSSPRVIDLSELYKMEKKIETESLQSLEKISQENSKAEKIEDQKKELERLKAESDKLLSETEQMVMELLDRVKEEARNILTTAQEEADNLKAQVQQEAEEIKQKAHTEGYETGLRRANEEIEADRQLAIQQSKEMIEEARQTKLEMMKSSESDMVRLAMAVAKKVIAGELITNPNIIINVLREALSFLDSADNIKVYVNQRDMDRILEVMKTETFSDIGNSDPGIELRSDNKISSGGCVLESELGSVDARYETRVENIKKAIQEVTADE